ncbi:MAG: FtsX-like permease family protein [Candidatus Limnocylindrales bacterium]
MIRLGLRLATAGGRGALGGLALTATAVAVGTAILLFALSFAPAVAQRDGRTAWRDGYVFASDPTVGTLMLIVEDRVEGQVLTRVHVARVGSDPAPVPPGIAAIPEPGTAYVSPALATRMTALPTNQLADRIGRVVGTIDGRSLASPDDLIAVIGADPVTLAGQGASMVSGFNEVAPDLDLPAIGVLIIVLAAVGAMAPVAVFVSTATRMSAARREWRLAALRLVGATPAQVARLAVIEALVATGVGAAGGIVLFAILRPLVAMIPLDAATWWPETIMPPVPAAVLLLVAVQVVGAAGALIAMRRLTVTPLGVQRRSVPPPPRRTRLVPLAVGLAALMVSIWFFRSGSLPDFISLGAVGLAFAAVIASLAFAGPWLTALVGQALLRSARGAASLLAARRIGDDPRGSFGAIAGVIMAVFVASAFFTFAAYTSSQAGRDTDPLLQPNAAVATLGQGARVVPDLADRIADVDGVTGVVAIRDVALIQGDAMVGIGWLASCDGVVRTLGLEGAACTAGGLATASGFHLDGGALSVVPDPADPTAGDPPRATVVVPPDGIGPLLAVEGDRAGFLPPLLVDPLALDDPAMVADFPITSLYVTTDGTPGIGERVRTALAAVAPAGGVRLAEERFAANGQFEEIGRIVALGLVGTLALAGCSLAVAVTTATLERRRQFVFLRSAGMPASSLRATLLLQAGVPLSAVAAASALLGALVGVAILWIAAGVMALPDVSLVGVLVVSLAVAMGIVALTLPPLERLTRPASIRHE